MRFCFFGVWGWGKGTFLTFSVILNVWSKASFVTNINSCEEKKNQCVKRWFKSSVVTIIVDNNVKSNR